MKMGEIENIRIDFANYNKNLPKEWKEYSKGKKVNGAFHGFENLNIPNFYNTPHFTIR